MTNIVVSLPMPAGTVLTLDTLDQQGNPLPLCREELDEPTDRVVLPPVDTDRPVLSLVIVPGPGAAFTGKPFFKPGATYIENRPYDAPEIRRYFRVTATDRAPDTGALYAFGFGRAGTANPWVLVILDEEQWAAGWIEQQDAVKLDGPQYAECPPDCTGCICAALGSMAPCSHCTDHFAPAVG